MCDILAQLFVVIPKTKEQLERTNQQKNWFNTF